MSSDLEVIKRIIDAFERSDWAEIDVRAGSLRVRLSTDAGIAPAAVDGVTGAVALPHPVGDEDAGADITIAPASKLPAERFPGALLVVSPSPGIFWRSPQPGAPPFASIGDHVTPSSTLCIVEIMKLMTHVKSEVGGSVVGVFVDDGTRVDQGDPLFAIALAS